MTKLTVLPSTATIKEVSEVILRDGGVVVEDMLSSEILDSFLADVLPYLDRTPFGEEGFTGNRTRRCSALLAKSLWAGDMITQKHFLGAAEELLPQPYEWTMGDETVTLKPALQLGNSQIIELWPGQGAQPLHRDDGAHHRRHPGPPSQIQVLYAGTDFTETNGATLVVPGSHLWDDERRPRPEEAVKAVMKRGSGLIYFGATYHAGGMNQTENEKRIAIAFSHLLGFLRQEENQYLVIPIEMVKKHTAQVQALLGYKISPPFCGWVEMQDPSIVLTSDDFAVGAAANLH